MTELSDENLLDAHQRGDTTAFEEIVRRYGDRLLGYLRRMSRDQQQAEDYFQETFRRVHEKARTFEGRSSFKSWLYRIAGNVALDGMRKVNREPQMTSLTTNREDHNPEYLEVSRAVASPRRDNPYEAAVRTEQAGQVQLAIEQLPERQRATLVLAYYQGLSYREVSQGLGCSLGTVKTQMYRALRALADKLPDVPGEVR
ncbi:MAG: sigma-70 family RNA polymerase sigma factor [Planctomycetes bacterium]|nr:sigma-70 family RNA polymerase sigma factor [Planctomycetota bacterium]